MADRYEVKGRLGRGGVGAVYQAFDHHLEREVAIKRLLPMEETKLNERAEETLKLEAKAIASLSHPNIVTIHEFGEDEQGPFVVFEMIEGDTLKEVVQSGGLSVVDFHALAEQALDALVAAQSIDILHRDIKPTNLMLSWLPSGKFQVKILDFGLSKFSEKPAKQTLDQKGAFLGSIDYIAPEQIELRPLDKRTDLYSLGCVLYFALTQRPPFAGENMAETMGNHLSGTVESLEKLRPDLPLAVSRWVMRMMSLHPKDRPANALEALEEFQAAKVTKDEAVTTAISSAKLVVPVIETVRPADGRRKLDQTKHIITAPSPRTGTVPSTHGRPAPSKSRHTKSKPLRQFLGLAALFSALAAVAWFFYEGRSEDAVRGGSPKANATPPAAKSFPKLSFQNGTTRSAANPPLPQLPLKDSLVSYFSVNGPLQNREGKAFDRQSETEWLGAVENAAPKSHKFHLLRTPDDPKRAPSVMMNRDREQTIQFEVGEKLLMPNRPYTRQSVKTDKVTIALLYRIPVQSAGSFFRMNLRDEDGKMHERAIRLSFFPGRLQLGSNDSKTTSRDELASDRYQIAIIQYDGETSELALWQRGQGNQDTPMIRGSTIPVNFSGRVQIASYEIGHLVNPKNPKMRKPIEIPALSIHHTALTEKEKRELSTLLFEAAFPDRKSPKS